MNADETRWPVHLRVHDYSGVERHRYIRGGSRNTMLLFVTDTTETSMGQRIDVRKHIQAAIVLSYSDERGQ
jgi:hypothetical protein